MNVPLLGRKNAPASRRGANTLLCSEPGQVLPYVPGDAYASPGTYGRTCPGSEHNNVFAPRRDAGAFFRPKSGTFMNIHFWMNERKTGNIHAKMNYS